MIIRDPDMGNEIEVLFEPGRGSAGSNAADLTGQGTYISI